MENVKGLLSSKHSGDPMFEKIIADLSMPTEGLEYEIRSFTKKGDGSSLVPTDYLIHSDRHGIPQSSHRVILLGLRQEIGSAHVCGPATNAHLVCRLLPEQNQPIHTNIIQHKTG